VAYLRWGKKSKKPLTPFRCVPNDQNLPGIVGPSNLEAYRIIGIQYRRWTRGACFLVKQKVNKTNHYSSWAKHDPTYRIINET
jgi:hypothetical protein